MAWVSGRRGARATWGTMAWISGRRRATWRGLVDGLGQGSVYALFPNGLYALTLVWYQVETEVMTVVKTVVAEPNTMLASIFGLN